MYESADIAILVPILGRPHLIAPLMANVAATTDPDVTLMFLPDATDVESIDELIANGAHWMESEATGWAGKINEAVRQHPWWQYIFCGADDVIFHKGWLDEVMRVMFNPNQHGDKWATVMVVGTLDALTSNVMAGEHATHFMVYRPYIDVRGGVIDEGPGSFLPTVYRHNWVDREFIETAKARGVYSPSIAVVEHAHHLNSKAAYDETYRLGDQSMNADAAIYELRRHLWESA